LADFKYHFSQTDASGAVPSSVHPKPEQLGLVLENKVRYQTIKTQIAAPSAALSHVKNQKRTQQATQRKPQAWLPLKHQS
jgi:hypothetical protein